MVLFCSCFLVLKRKGIVLFSWSKLCLPACGGLSVAHEPRGQHPVAQHLAVWWRLLAVMFASFPELIPEVNVTFKSAWVWTFSQYASWMVQKAPGICDLPKTLVICAFLFEFKFFCLSVMTRSNIKSWHLWQLASWPQPIFVTAVLHLPQLPIPLPHWPHMKSLAM